MRKFLQGNGYLRSFTKKEILELSVPDHQYDSLKQLSEEVNVDLDSLFSIYDLFSGNIWSLSLVNVDAVPGSLLLFKDTLKRLYMRFKDDIAATIPEWFGDLETLEELKIRGPLTTLPESFGKLKHLKYAELYVNLTSLPESFGDLGNLRRLALNYNQLTSLPASFKNLKRLYDLELKGNKFEAVPEVLSDMENLELVSLNDNPIPESVAADFISSAEHVSSRYYKIKNTEYYI